ncbi:MAG TPA: ECF transporter S component [Clostridiales bacterium]|jgi:riboflavin transporter FmnP|nr:ECF transporter S component [Clostridiales bacterium]
MSDKTSVLKRGHVKVLTKISMLSAVAGVLMLLQTPLWFAPNFYKLDFSEVAVLIGGFALGPVAAIIIEFIKILLNLVLNGTMTGGVGEMANFLIGCSLVVPASVIYHRNKTMKSAVIGMVIGIVTMAIFASLANYFVLLPVYAKVYGVPLEFFVNMGNALNSSINSLETLILYAVVPFNLLKGIAVSAVTVLIYKKVSPILHK